jgi:hypothetical protein
VGEAGGLRLAGQLIQLADVLPILEIAEKLVTQGMLYGVAPIIRLQVSFRNVSRMLCLVNQDMVPGLVLRGTASGHVLIPFVFALKGCIDIDDDPAIIEEKVMNELTNGKLTGALSHKP